MQREGSEKKKKKKKKKKANELGSEAQKNENNEEKRGRWGGRGEIKTGYYIRAVLLLRSGLLSGRQAWIGCFFLLSFFISMSFVLFFCLRLCSD